MEATVAAYSMPVYLSRNIRHFRQFQGFFRRYILRFTAGADTTQQSLGDNTSQTGSDQIRRYAHVAKTVDSGNRVFCMDGGDNQMAGHSSSHGDLCCLTVSDLTYADDIRVLTQDGTKSGSEGQTYFFIDLYLGSAFDMVLYRILQCDQVGTVRKQFPYQCIHSGGLTGTGRTYDHDNTGSQA